MNRWVRHLAISNIKKHRRRNVFSILSLIVGLTSSFLIIGFSLNAENSIKEECYKQFDYGNLTITKENKSESKNGGLSIVRSTRPSLKEMQSLKSVFSDYEIDIDLSALVPQYLKITYGKEELKDYSYESIYSFVGNYVDKELLIEGEFPRGDNLGYVLINEKAKSDFIKKYKTSPINKIINVYYECDYPYYLDDEYQPVVKDYFIYDRQITIVGVVKDLNFLSTPKIYYSYLALKDYLSVVYLNNLSTYFDRNYSWVDRIDESNSSDQINSYMYRLFLKDYRNSKNVSSLLSKELGTLVLDSPSQTRTDALLSLINAATTGMELFLVISLIGTALIMGIVSFSFYSEDRKTIAILSCLGAKMNSINDIYCLENILIGVVAFAISIILAPILQIVINLIVKNVAGYSNIIGIPFFSFMNIPFGLPILVLVGTLLVSIISTLLPISFSKKISLKEELKDE